MPYTRTTSRKLLKYLFIMAIALVVCTYAVWRSLNYARGPSIMTIFPANNTATTLPTIILYGKADRVSSISLNGRQITVDENGNFSETLVLFRGVNVITLQAKDQFDRSTQKEMRLLGE